MTDDFPRFPPIRWPEGPSALSDMIPDDGPARRRRVNRDRMRRYRAKRNPPVPFVIERAELLGFNNVGGAAGAELGRSDSGPAPPTLTNRADPEGSAPPATALDAGQE